MEGGGHGSELERSHLAAAQHLPAEKCSGKQVWSCCALVFAGTLVLLLWSGDRSILPRSEPIRAESS